MRTVKANDGKTYALPDNPVWRTGPPPEIGWWPANHIGYNYPGELKYWDGKDWSIYSNPDENGSDTSPSRFPAERTKWTDRWWLNQPEGFPK